MKENIKPDTEPIVYFETGPVDRSKEIDKVDTRSLEEFNLTFFEQCLRHMPQSIRLGLEEYISKRSEYLYPILLFCLNATNAKRSKGQKGTKENKADYIEVKGLDKCYYCFIPKASYLMVLKMEPTHDSKARCSLNLYSVVYMGDINIGAIIMTGAPVLAIKGKSDDEHMNQLAVYFDGLSLKSGKPTANDFTFVMELLGQLNTLRLTSKQYEPKRPKT